MSRERVAGTARLESVKCAEREREREIELDRRVMEREEGVCFVPWRQERAFACAICTEVTLQLDWSVCIIDTLKRHFEKSNKSYKLLSGGHITPID